MTKAHGRTGRWVIAAIAITMAVLGAGPATATGSDGAGDAARAVTHEKVKKTSRIPNRTIVHKTHRLKRGVTKVVRPGHSGVRVTVFRLTLDDGHVTDRDFLWTRVRRHPAARVVLKGTGPVHTAPTHRCDPNYSGCVPIASDVDCAGGSGNGPAYVQGPVRVIGNDIYGLDADGDGWGCD
jgi:hypothetical protein